MADSNRTLIEQFYISFNERRTVLSSRLDACKAAGEKSKDVLDRVALDIAQLRKELSDATVFLPSYDQRQYETQVKSFEQSLDQLRTASVAKPKFAFKRKQAVSGSSSAAVDTKKPAPPDVSSSAAAALSNNARALSGHTGAFLGFSALPASSSTSGSELTISDIDRCIIDLLPSANGASSDLISALHVKNVTNSVLLLPVIPGSAILHDVKNTVLVIGCHQFRMHTSSRVDVYLSIPSNPIIEHCSDVRFSSYPTYFNPSPGNETSNKYLSVQDFSHIRATPSPNWTALPEHAIIAQEKWPRTPAAGDIASIAQELLPPS